VSMRLSPDGMYYWDGEQWLSTLSHDGRFRWNGSTWVPTGQVAGATTYQQPGRPLRQPTSWTRPLQYSVAGWYALQAVYALALPFWMTGPMAQAMTEGLRRQQQLYPTVSPPPVEFTSAMTSILGGVLWVGALFGLAISLVAIVGALNRWAWTYYVVLVLLGLSAISLPINLINAFSGSAISAASGFSLPSWTYWLGLVLAIPAAALFIWMLVALIKRGPWAMAKVSPAVS
jgi:hypothetical protein